MKKRILCTLCAMALLISGLLSGCGEKAAKKPAIPITVKDEIPSATVGEAYDLAALVTQEEGVTYDFAASYQDPESGESKDLKIKKGKITPKAEADISVTITATKGKDSSSLKVIVPIRISADIMDQLLADSSDSIRLTKDAEHLQGENSTSALEIKFTNGEKPGTALLDLSHSYLYPYYSAQVWKNAAVSFWVYNPMEQDVELKLGCREFDADLTISWDSPENANAQIAKAKSWTNIALSLYDLGIVKPIMKPEDYAEDYSLEVLAHYTGEGECTLYVDGMDIVHADSVEGLISGYTASPLPSGDYSNLLQNNRVYTDDTIAQLTKSSVNNGSKYAYTFGSNQAIGYPTFYIDFPTATDISGFDYLKFDILADNAYPHVTVAIRYLDEHGEIQKHGISYDYYNNHQWQTIYLNLDYVHRADLTKVVGICFSVHMDSRFVAGQYNAVHFDNISLYQYPHNEPQMSPALVEDNDLISGKFQVANNQPNINGVCKVATDEAGKSRSNSALLFWTNNACGYPCVDATFHFDTAQDWSDYSILSFDTHQSHGHYWLEFTILYIDAFGNQQTALWRHDTILDAWKTNHASLDWFTNAAGETIKPSELTQVVGFRIAANMAINVTAEVAQIYFDNFVLS
ncbi:MAG: hypothetical protein IKW10_03685 [Oscillospiraceae bacterium]|nr:hypothetical protein [Oscillospiraceae bacterium]